LVREDFEDTRFISRGWYDATGYTVTASEHIPGSTKSLELDFAKGATTPPPHSAMRVRFPASDAVYLSYWVKYSANWVGSGLTFHPHEFQFLTNEDPPYLGPSATHLTTYVEHNYRNGGIPVLRMQDALNIDTTRLNQDLSGSSENRAAGGCNGNSDGYPTNCYRTGATWSNGKSWMASAPAFLPTPGPGYKNDWHHVEAYFKLNTIQGGKGQQDGIARYWFDGQLVLDEDNVLFRTGVHSTMMFDQFLIAPYIGGTAKRRGSPVAQSMWVDNLIIAAARP
jgi:hypothetical protein